jgi:CubicO group peptidase (beta-lactamase class C family)
MKKVYALHLVMSLLVCGVTTAASDKIDDYVKTELQNKKIPGLALAILRDGKVKKMQGYGYSNVEHRVNVIPETIFQSGSVGKQFTATAVMMLVDEGKINLDDSIAKYFKSSPNYWKPITIRHLLTHTSGIPDYSDKQVDFRRDYTEDQLQKVLVKLKPQFRAGEKWSYSNSGYMLLGFLIRKVSGKFYGDYLQEKVFRPLAMISTRIITEADIVANRAAGYQLVKGELKNQDWVAPTINTTADGSLYVNVVDLAKWDQALYDETLLKQSLLRQMWTPVILKVGIPYPYGFGWSFDYQRNHRIIQHGGHWQGFSTAICRYVEDRLTVIVLANLAGVNAVTIAHNVAGLYEPSLLSPRFMPASAEAVSKPDATELKQKLFAFASGRSKGRITRGLETVTEREERKEATETLKKMKSFEFIACDSADSASVSLYGSPVDRFCYYKINDGTTNSYATFALTPEGQLAGYWTEPE